ncbi:DDE_3 domain-containing protein [Trichonephila clavipes]|nr:DDE_3 domain-containing protein [Trichonephila clavipes]
MSVRYDRDYLLQTDKNGDGSVMIWAAVSWFSAEPIVTLKGRITGGKIKHSYTKKLILSYLTCVTLKGRITGEKYKEILSDQVHPMMQTLLSAIDGIFQDDNAPVHAAGLVRPWFDEHEDEVKFSPWPAQPPNLNIIEPLRSILEYSIRNRYTQPASLPVLLQYLHEEWYNIPPNTLQHLYESILRQIRTVLHAKGGPTPY